MLIAFGIFKKHGMLVPNVNPYIQLLIMYPAASWGSTMPDLDTSKSSVSEHTPLSMATNLFLRMLGAKHRSWQTHCLVITGGLTVALPVLLEIWGKGVFSSFDLRFLRLLIYGLSIGVFSHLALDAITPEGIHVIPNVKMRLVPRLPFFSTGGPWEKLVCASTLHSNRDCFSVYILWQGDFEDLAGYSKYHQLKSSPVYFREGFYYIQK